jgi:hypothetical protein
MQESRDKNQETRQGVYFLVYNNAKSAIASYSNDAWVLFFISRFLALDSYLLNLSYLPAHFCSNSFMKYPPTTLRAWKPTCLPLVVSCQSFSGTREGVSVANL